MYLKDIFIKVVLFTVVNFSKLLKNIKNIFIHNVYLSTDYFEKDDKYVFKAGNSCCMQGILAYKYYFVLIMWRLFFLN